MTKSAPSSAGQVARGVAKVESTASTVPAAWAIPAAAAKWGRVRIGVAGV